MGKCWPVGGRQIGSMGRPNLSTRRNKVRCSS
jgi:hypothetical protein